MWLDCFDGKQIKGVPIITIVNGNVVYENGKILDTIKGLPVQFHE